MDKVWDFTTIDTFQTCRRKYYWRMVKHLVPVKKAPSLQFGGAMHSALDTYYTDGIDKAKAVFTELYQTPEGEAVKTTQNGLMVLDNYAKRYQDEELKVFGKPETKFTVDIGINWCGRMDLPVLWGDELWIMEHKTTSRLPTNPKMYNLDKQITGYVVAAELYFNRPCRGCLINLLEIYKPLVRPTAKSKSAMERFLRIPQMRSEMLKERFKENVRRIVRDILWCEENNEFYEAEKRDVCFSYNYDCSYRELCQYGEDRRLIKGNFVEEKWSPAV